MDLDDLDDFFNNNVTNPFEGKEKTYKDLGKMLYVDEYVNNATDTELESDSYDTYIRGESNFPD